jgi:hypothetical protein
MEGMDGIETITVARLLGPLMEGGGKGMRVFVKERSPHPIMELEVVFFNQKTTRLINLASLPW